MPDKTKHINGYILAGGKSSRMGTDKGLLNFKGKPLVLKVIEQLQGAVHKTVIVSNNPEYEKFGLEVIPDLIQAKGPAGGIHAALSHTDSEQNFVVSCDMPFITTAAIQYMIKNASQSQITLPLYQTKMQPLFGVYSKECLPLWQELIQQKIVKLQEMITHFKLLELNIDKNELFPNLFFININDKNDFQKALNQS